MRTAPPVQYPVGLFLWWRRAIWLFFAMSVLSAPVLLWATPLAAASLTGTLLLVCAMAWALNRYQNKVCKTSGYLLWDEGCWHYMHDGQVGGIEHLSVLWDAGDRIWLRWSSLMPGSRRSWSEAWLLNRDAPEHWHLLRCAVAAHSGKNFTQPSH